MRVNVHIFSNAGRNYEWYDTEEYNVPDDVVANAKTDNRLTYEIRQWLEKELLQHDDKLFYVCVDESIIGYPLMVYPKGVVE